MPYRGCVRCGQTLYSAARWSTSDRCPNCDSALRPAPRSGTQSRLPPALKRRFGPESAAPQAARRALESLGGRIEGPSLVTGRLLVSELVTNSVRHGPNHDSAIELRVWAGGGRLRVEVADEGPGVEAVPPAPPQDSESHWGLHLVHTLADRWGAEREPEAFVWFELDGNSAESEALEPGLREAPHGPPASAAATGPIGRNGSGPHETPTPSVVARLSSWLRADRAGNQ